MIDIFPAGADMLVMYYALDEPFSIFWLIATRQVTEKIKKYITLLKAQRNIVLKYISHKKSQKSKESFHSSPYRDQLIILYISQIFGSVQLVLRNERV